MPFMITVFCNPFRQKSMNCRHYKIMTEEKKGTSITLLKRDEMQD